MPLSSREVGRAARQSIRRVAEPRHHTAAARDIDVAGEAVPEIGDLEYNLVTFGRSKWDTHVWSSGGKIVFGRSKWGKHVWG